MVIGIDASRAFAADRTGTENYSYHLITHILRLPTAKKHSFVLFIRPNAKIPSQLAGLPNVEVKKVSWPRLWTQGGLAWETWKRFKILDSRFELDVLWVPAHTLPVLMNPKVKTVVTIHGLEYRWLPEYSNYLQRWYLPLSTFYAAYRANHLICVSESTRRDLLAEVAIDQSKITVIPEGVSSDNSDVSERQRVSEPVGQTILDKYSLTNKKYILFVGTVQPRKNLATLIQAFAQLRPRLRGDMAQIKLVIAGGVGWKAEAHLALASKLGIDNAVILTGRVSDLVLRALYQGAALYVQPSWTEGFGLPVLEAMSHGVAVIVSDGGALPEVVGDAAIVVELKGGPHALATAIERVMSDNKLKNRLIKIGRVRAGEFTWERAARATLDLLLRG